MSRIVVTGGAGFIGSHVVAQALDLGHEVLIVDNLVSGSIDNVEAVRRQHVAKSLGEFSLELAEVDINYSALVDVFTTFRPDVVLHLAAHVDVIKSIENIEFDLESNLSGTIAVLSAARQSGCKRVVITGSAAIYGDVSPDLMPLNEATTLKPCSPYGASKLGAMAYAGMLSRLWEIDCCVVVPSNVYGPRQGVAGEGGVVSLFTKAVCDNRDFAIFGTGYETRDFIYVGDVAAAFLTLGTFPSSFGGSTYVSNDQSDESPFGNSALGVPAFHASTGMETTINELAAMAIDIAESKSSIEFRPPRDGEILRSALSSQKLQTSTNWKPLVDLQTGLALTIEWIRNPC